MILYKLGIRQTYDMNENLINRISIKIVLFLNCREIMVYVVKIKIDSSDKNNCNN